MSQNVDTQDLVKKILLEHLSIDEKEIVPEANIMDDLKADSLNAAEIILGLEEEFNIEISEADAESIKTVGDAINCVQKILAK